MSEKVKRILLLSTAYLPAIGGSELALKNITERLDEYEFDIITGHTMPGTPEKEQQGNVTIYRVGGPLAMSQFLVPKIFLPFAIAFKASQLLKKNEYALMHAYQASQAAGAGWIIKHVYPSLKFLLTVQEGKNLGAQPWIIRYLRSTILKSIDRATVISTYLQKYVQSIREDIVVDLIPNGVDTNLFSRRDASFLRGQLNIPDQHAVIVSISRLVEKNGIEYLISAFKEVSIKHLSSLVIVGDGPLKKSLQTLTKELDIGHLVHFISACPPAEVVLYLSLADVFIRPSLSEGFGTAFIEAMSVGVPVIGPAVGGITDFLINEKTGLVCISHDPHDIARQILRLLNDKTLQNELVQNAKTMVNERYTWDYIAEQMRSVYDQIINNKHQISNKF